MAYQITSESYGRRLPKITATADSTDDLSTLGTDWAEGSTCVIGSTTYSLDKVQGWVEPGSGGGGGGIFVVKFSADEEDNITADKTFAQTYEAAQSGAFVYGQGEYGGFLYLGMVESSTLVFYSPATASAEGVYSDRYVWLPDDTINLYADDYPRGS